MTSQPIVSFSSVTKRYPGGQEVLRNVGFEVTSGEVVFITGPSGAGKSTLLKLVAGIERANSGTVLVAGQNVTSMHRNALPFLRRNLGLVLQDHKLLHDRTAFDNVMLPLRVIGEPPKDAERRARAALDKVGLLNREKARPLSLSGGEQQRLCIARAVVNRPSILIADEPTASLDSTNARMVMEIFRSFNQVGVTVMIATHDRDAIAQLNARVLTLSQGQIA